jgi:hypothetical protein
MSVDRSPKGNRIRSHFDPLLVALVGVLAFPGNVLAESLEIAWDAVSGASGYLVSYGTASRNYTQTVDALGNTKATVTGLTSGTTYYFAVRAYSGSKTSGYSGEVSGVPGSSGGGSPKLVAAYGFDETSADTTVLDASGNGNHGSFLNARRVTRAKFGQALAFAGSNSLVTVSDSASLDLTTGMTLAAWIFPTTELSSWKSIITKERTGGLTYALHANSATEKPNTVLYISGGNRHLNAGSRLPANRWTHLATTYDGLTQRIFVNGVQVGSRSQKGSIEATAEPLRIGGNTVTGRYFKGVIDEVRIYDGALSQADIVKVSGEPVNP